MEGECIYPFIPQTPELVTVTVVNQPGIFVVYFGIYLSWSQFALNQPVVDISYFGPKLIPIYANVSSCHNAKNQMAFAFAV